MFIYVSRQPGSASGLRRHVAASLMQHYRLVERNNRAIEPVSPASYGSSMEVTILLRSYFRQVFQTIVDATSVIMSEYVVEFGFSSYPC